MTGDGENGGVVVTITGGTPQATDAYLDFGHTIGANNIAIGSSALLNNTTTTMMVTMGGGYTSMCLTSMGGGYTTMGGCTTIMPYYGVGGGNYTPLNLPTPAERSLELLNENLTPAQREMFATRRYFEVVGGDSGKRYRIRYGRSMNIDELNSLGQPCRLWCFLPASPMPHCLLPEGDCMLAQKVALELNETFTMRRIAILQGGRRGDDMEDYNHPDGPPEIAPYRSPSGGQVVLTILIMALMAISVSCFLNAAFKTLALVAR